MSLPNERTNTQNTFPFAIVAAIVALFVLLAGFSSVATANAASSDLQAGSTSDDDVQVSTQGSSVRYIAIFGADTWVNHHAPASDMTAVVRLGTSSGTVSFLTIPRDLRYDGITKLDPAANFFRVNFAFRDFFNKTIDSTWSNYDEALRAGAEAECKVVSGVTGIKVTDYVVVDLFTYKDIVNKLGGVTVNIPVGIKNYVLYSDKSVHSVNGGKTGTATLNGSDAVIASRARVPYGPEYHRYASKSDYKGDYPELLVRKPGFDYYRFDTDTVRQFLNRRTFAALVDKGLGRSEGAASFVWNVLVSQKLIWTNLSQSDVTSMANALSTAKDKCKLVMYGAQIQDPSNGKDMVVKGIKQYLLPVKSSQITATVAQFKAGEPMTSGFAPETLIGLAKGSTKKVSGITYKVTSNSTVSVVSIPNKKTVTIPAKVKINGKYYLVTATLAKSMKGSKVRTVILGSNIKKIASKTFYGSKATTVKLKTTLLKKAKVKNCFKGSKVKKVKVAVAKAKKKALLKKYKKFFTKKNTGAKYKIKLS